MLLGLSPSLVREGDAAQCERQLRCKFFSRQVSLNAIPLLAGAIEKHYAWRPQHVKAMEICRRFFDVEGYGKKILVDEICDLVIGIRFGLQPNACASSRGSAEVKQHRLAFSLCPG